jgi:DNA polymerase-3 subunit epsilon
MNTALFFDSETTGLPLFKEPSEDPRQPHIVQLGALLVDVDTRKVLSSLDLISRPEGWTIPDEVVAVHGITTEKATAVGVDESLAVELMLDMHSRAKFRVAHNEGFDARIVRIALMRFFGQKEADAWKEAPAQCTAEQATPIMAPPAGNTYRLQLPGAMPGMAKEPLAAVRT